MGYVKKIFLLFVPPIFIKLFKRRYQYMSKFETYQSAQNVSNIYKDKKASEKFLGPDNIEVSGRFNLIPLLVLSLNKKKIKILDYGGGANPVYSYIKNSTNINVKTYVVEPENFCKIIKNKIPKKHKKFINYVSSIDKLNTTSFDIVCFNSSMQYLENYESIIKKLSKFKPVYYLITRTNFHMGKKNYYALECGIKDSLHPYIFFSVHQFTKLMKSNSYNLIFSNKYNINRYKHKSIDGRTFFHKDMIFKRFKN